MSRKTRYGLRALYALAEGGAAPGPVLIADLAERENIPRKFLEAILLELKNAGLLSSKKGKGGGYTLARSPDQITLAEVVRVLEGPLEPVPCLAEKGASACDECTDAATCGTRLVMKQVRDAVSSILEQTTLALVITQSARARRHATPNVAYSI